MDEPSLPTAEDEARFYAAVGRAVTDWAKVEKELFEISATVLGCSERHASVVFYRTPTIDSRLTLTGDLLEAAFPHKSGDGLHPIIKAWRLLQSDIKDGLPIRNALAHHPVGPVLDIYESPDGQQQKFEYQLGSYLSLSQHQRKPSQPLDILGFTEIEAHISVIEQLIGGLVNLRRLLSEQHGRCA